MDYTAETILNFTAELDYIDFDYILFFILREPVVPGDIRDRLRNHYYFEVECGKAYFAFQPDSDLPLKIRKKCVAQFISFFQNGVCC